MLLWLSYLLTSAICVLSVRRMLIIKCHPCICYEQGVNKEITANCSRLKLNHIPKTIPSNIQALYFKDNCFTKIRNNQFSNFPNLTTLLLEGNQLSDIELDGFQGLRHLQVLDMGYNRLSCDIPCFKEDIFKPLKKLTILRLLGNTRHSMSCEYPNHAIKDLLSLEELYIDGIYNKSFGPNFKKLESLRKLVLSDDKHQCFMFSLHNETFINVPYVKVLLLRHCELKFIGLNTFAPLKHISHLDLSDNNQLGIPGIVNATYGLQNSTIINLSINRIVSNMAVCVIFVSEISQHLQNTSLVELHANGNFFEKFDQGTLIIFPQTLETLHLRENRFVYGPYIFYFKFKNLISLDISGQPGNKELPNLNAMDFLQDDEPYCEFSKSEEDDEVIDFIPDSNYQRLDLDAMRTVPLPPQLKRFTSTYNQLSFDIPAVTFGKNSLTHFNLSSNLLSTWIGPVYGLVKLEVLDLSNNIARNVSLYFFQNLTGLKTLNVSLNGLGPVISRDSKGQLFSTLHNLETLDLSQNYIQYLRENTFNGLVSLMNLCLSGNIIHSFPSHVTQMKNLQTVILTNNQIRWLPRQTRQEFTALVKGRKVKLYLELYTNPFSCSCNNLNFFNWILSSSNIDFGNFSNYYCIYPIGKLQSLADFSGVYENLDSSCLNNLGLSLGTLAVTVFVTSGIIGAIVYRFRWKARYWFYAAKLRYSKLVDVTARDSFEFDAFISHADEDSHFVLNEMIENLEQTAHLKVCIHQRDFLAGRPIAQNIVKAVQTSRRTMVVLSENFLSSSWCNYELEMANMERVTTGRDVVLILMYSEVQIKDIPPEISYHIKNDSYIEYPHTGPKYVFWRSVIDALKS